MTNLRTPLLVVSSLAIGFGAVMALRLYLNVARRRVWDLGPALTITGVLLSAWVLGRLIFHAPAVPTTAIAWAYFAALALKSVGLIIWTFARRGGRRRTDR